MIVPDANLLLYAEIDAFPQHEAARRWWEQAMNGERQVGIAADAVEYGGEVYSNDADFSRFAGVRWVNPLTSESHA